VSEDRELRRIFGLERDEETGGWRKLHSEKLRNLYSSPSVNDLVKVDEMSMECSMHGGEDECL
jgi:hypothetical protein